MSKGKHALLQRRAWLNESDDPNHQNGKVKNQTPSLLTLKCLPKFFCRPWLRDEHASSFRPKPEVKSTKLGDKTL